MLFLQQEWDYLVAFSFCFVRTSKSPWCYLEFIVVSAFHSEISYGLILSRYCFSHDYRNHIKKREKHSRSSSSHQILPGTSTSPHLDLHFVRRLPSKALSSWSCFPKRVIGAMIRISHQLARASSASCLISGGALAEGIQKYSRIRFSSVSSSPDDLVTTSLDTATGVATVTMNNAPVNSLSMEM
jgi:hypothetical protein